MCTLGDPPSGSITSGLPQLVFLTLNSVLLLISAGMDYNEAIQGDHTALEFRRDFSGIDHQNGRMGIGTFPFVIV